jgi:hypothetical protein
MKKILIPYLLLITTIVQAQLNNSWIDYSKTYYKFRLGTTGLCRINQSILSAAGLGSVSADQFQLWRNGQQVPIYTSIASGSFGSNDYIEFLGQSNDGKPDKKLYLDSSFQLSDTYSLFTDTVAYYLTVNSSGGNLRYTNTANVIPANPPAADAYFMNHVETSYRNYLNPGYAVYVTEPIYSSAFDMGEGWVSSSFGPCSFCNVPNLSATFSNLNVYSGAPANSVSFYVSAFSNSNVDYTNSRNLQVLLSNNVLLDTPLSGFSIVKRKIGNLPLSLLQNNSATATLNIYNCSDPANDQAVAATLSLTYPSTFNFNNQANYYFELAAAPVGDYLVINNFNNANSAPVLYDLTDDVRYTGDISVAGVIRFSLPGSIATTRKFLLVSEDASNIAAINTLTSRQFIDYANVPDNQGNYIIISNPLLYNDGSGNNNVEAYRAYRASAAGGSYIAKTVSINELTDQFGLGIKNHPAAIRDFIQSTQSWTIKPKYIFIIGRGVVYTDARTNESSPSIGQLDLVPTFGYPASDVLLSTPPQVPYVSPGQVMPLVPIGRLPVVSGLEIRNYLDKMMDYESAQASTTQTIEAKGWMKNFVHISGGATESETEQFAGLLNGYAAIASDSLEGANVSTFLKSSTAYVEQLAGNQIQQLITNGVNFIDYFGHASSTTFAFNLADPSTYQNVGKYPFFNVSGCTAGDFYTYDLTRLTNNILSISENWTLAKQSGSIGFLADTYLGIPPNLDYYNTALYRNFSLAMYGNTIGNQIKQVDQTIGGNPSTLASYQGFYMRTHLEEINLNGDPALKINSFSLPDFVVEPQLVKINPSVISVANGSFTVNVQMMNIGRAVDDSMNVLIERQLPNDSIVVLYNKVIPAIIYLDSLNFTIPINPATDAGDNKIIVKLNSDGRISELSTANNSVTIDFTIYQDELNPVYPYNYSIVNNQGITCYASTANAISNVPRQYLMQMDTTALFNSPFMKQYTASGPVGLIQFTPTTTFTDSTVYYWRTAIVPLTNATPIIWNSSSFVYLPTGGTGFNQSHYYQHLNSSYSNINLGADRVFRFAKTPTSLEFGTGIFPYYGNAGDAEQLYVNLGTVQIAYYGCAYSVLQVIVYDSSTFAPWVNYNVNNNFGRFGSDVTTTCTPPNATRNYFEFQYGDPTSRENFLNFLDSIPTGKYVSITNVADTANHSFINDWQTPDGSGRTLYATLKNIGFTKIDSFTHNLPFLFFFQKGTSYTPTQVMGASVSSYIQDTIPIATSVTSGTITSPLFGPAKAWTSLHWNGKDIDPGPGDSVLIQVYGVGPNGTGQTLLATVAPAKDTSLSFINAAQYPYLQLVMQNSDSVYATPNQLSFWRINANYVPEGAVAPNILYTMKDTLNQGQKIAFAMAFKNISQVAFDSMQFKFAITNAGNVQDTFAIPKGKALVSGDTLVVRDTIDTKNFPGNNTLYVMVNPNNDQPEQYLFNNSITQNFYVIPDNSSPLLDVTFDGVHILNKDLVSSKPHIVIKLTDNNQFLALSDTSLIKVQVYFPDPSNLGNGTLVTYHFGDSMQFIPANLATGQNVATINLIGNFPVDGQYQLIVSGKDEEGNSAGELEYRVSFNVINKTMISNLFNYPNPFTTSTAFVFTLTGNQLPQNMRIQILTITGKVVKEITQSELGPLHVGDNITQYKWNGTDMYGQKLANGVYLYRVLTNLNGKSIQKYSGVNANGETITDGLNSTDQYFTKGYGKMYLMR